MRRVAHATNVTRCTLRRLARCEPLCAQRCALELALAGLARSAVALRTWRLSRGVARAAAQRLRALQANVRTSEELEPTMPRGVLLM